jgi:hypothetical protein
VIRAARRVGLRIVAKGTYELRGYVSKEKFVTLTEEWDSISTVVHSSNPLVEKALAEAAQADMEEWQRELDEWKDRYVNKMMEMAGLDEESLIRIASGIQKRLELINRHKKRTG